MNIDIKRLCYGAVFFFFTCFKTLDVEASMILVAPSLETEGIRNIDGDLLTTPGSLTRVGHSPSEDIRTDFEFFYAIPVGSTIDSAYLRVRLVDRVSSGPPKLEVIGHDGHSVRDTIFSEDFWTDDTPDFSMFGGGLASGTSLVFDVTSLVQTRFGMGETDIGFVFRSGSPFSGGSPDEMLSFALTSNTDVETIQRPALEINFTEAVAVPEPSAIALLMTGGMVLVGFRWRRKKSLAA
ncbi:MAG: PEP-CTERM sorting domain-containing protein [Planctomycetaceae bacterium]